MTRQSSKPGDKKPSPPISGTPFPLFPHKGRGYWAKKVLGRLIYFGKVADDPDGSRALQLWEAQREDLLAGRVPRQGPDVLTVAKLIDHFLTAKADRRDSGELSGRTFRQYHGTCEAVLKFLGRHRAVDDLKPTDFERLRSHLAKGRGPVALGNEITVARMLFLHASKAALTDRQVQFGNAFDKPSQAVLRRARADKGPRMFTAAELRTILDAAGQPLKAMILLGVNCGFGAGDLSEIRDGVVDWGRGWVVYPRPKTGIFRSCPLWPETLQALKEARAQRTTSKNPADHDRVFLTAYGRPWVRENREKRLADGGGLGTTRNDAIGKEFAKLLDTLGLKREGLGFYALRHTTETVGGDAADQVAVDVIMGHHDPSMAARYREAVFAPRLQAVADHIHKWLFGDQDEKASAPKSKRKPRTGRKQVAADSESPSEGPVLRIFVG